MRSITEQEKQRAKEAAIKRLNDVYEVHLIDFEEKESRLEDMEATYIAALASSIPSDLLDRMREALEKEDCRHCSGTGRDIYNGQKVNCLHCSGTGQKHHLLLKELKEYTDA